MKTLLLAGFFILKLTSIYPQIRVGFELGANSVFADGIKNQDFQLRSKIDFSAMNIGCFVSLHKNKHLLSIGYRGSSLDGAFKVSQASAPRLSVSIVHYHTVNRFYTSYSYSVGKMKIGGSISAAQFQNGGYGISSSMLGVGTSSGFVESDLNAPRKWYLVPALELSYDLKIKNKTRLTAILEIPVWRFTGYNIFYESTVNSEPPESINIKPKFYAIYLHLRVPLFTLGQNWAYFNSRPKSIEGL